MAQSEIWPSAIDGRSKPGLATTSNAGGLRSAAARAPSLRICEPSPASTALGQVACGLENCTAGSENCTATRSYGSSCTSQYEPDPESDFSGPIFRLPVNSSTRQAEPASTLTCAVVTNGVSLTA